MPVVALSTDRWDASEPTECDVCIVGSGPAGATIARELADARLRVVVLESGGFARSPEADLLNEVESVGWPRTVDQWAVRNRIVGGSSHTWGGRCAPFDAIDFEPRAWTPHSGWPIRLNQLAPHLERSAAHLGLAVGTGFSGDEFWTLAGRKAPARRPDPQLLRSFFWQFSRDPEESYPYEYMRFGRSLAERLPAHTVLVTEATVLRIHPVESGRAVRAVEYVGPDGRRRMLRADNVVLCAGGIENARILLSSDTVTPNGLGNGRDLVGRYLMDHLRGPVGAFDPGRTRRLQKRLGRYSVQGRLFRGGFRLSPEVQAAEGLLNCAAWLGETFADDDPWIALRHLLGGRPELPGDLLSLATNAGFLVRGLLDHVVERNGVPRKLDALDLVCMCEQRPNPDSRVTLSERRDAFGLRLPKVDWRTHDDEARTLRRTGEIVADQLVAMGFPAPRLADWVRDGGGLPTSFQDVAHPTGTTRMADDPARGVVDADCQVHGVSGLFVAGSSVFPTAGHCNPTQMIVALAVRLADELKARARTARPPSVRTAAEPGPGRGRVLVTGATGRIGRVLVADLLERGYAVRAVSSKPAPAESSVGRLEWRRFDFFEDADYDGLVEGCDAVLHLAAELGRSDRMWRVNVEATRNLAAAAERARLRSFGYASSVSVYGGGLGGRVMTEDSPVLTVERDVASEYWALEYVRTYGRTKLAGERALREIAKHVPYVILRPTVVVDVGQIIGIRDWSLFKRTLAAHRHAHHIYVGDVSAALIWAMERAGEGAPGRVETFNLSEDDYPEPTYAQFMSKAFAASGDARFRVVPAPWIGDWLHDFIRFRGLPLRHPLWRLRFPSERLRAAGYRPRFGLGHAYELALAALRREAEAAAGQPAIPPAAPPQAAKTREPEALPAA